jgi:putative component of membrane protein insertase Oxa1/YidC/SpoIIIJ protein YidD
MKAYGFIIGGWMALRRILRCHPWAKSGYDPVPFEITTKNLSEKKING